jgi:hypothetical protein
MIQVLGVAHSDVAGNALIETALAENAQRCGQALPAQLTLLGYAALLVWQHISGRIGIHYDTVGCLFHYCAPVKWLILNFLTHSI